MATTSVILFLFLGEVSVPCHREERCKFFLLSGFVIKTVDTIVSFSVLNCKLLAFNTLYVCESV